MTDIIIKSFNRPFYLDRCLKSIQKNVIGNYSILILDDGTPEKYLEKIMEKHPSVQIKKSDNYIQKSKAIQENLRTGKEIDGFQIPTDLWINAAKSASEYFIMTEDDVWITDNINIDELVSEAKKHDINLLKLGWLGNHQDDQDLEIRYLSENINIFTPKNLFLNHVKVMEAYFYNRFKFFSILYILGYADNRSKDKYWALNSILMGLYKKEYWLEIWKDMHGKVDEKRQLINASVYYKKHRHRNFLARFKAEVMKTTFQCSATNSYHQYGNRFDANLFNHQISEAWYDDRFDAMQNYPKDFSLSYFERFLDTRIDLNDFRNWVEKFQNQYKNLGCNVE